MNLQTGISPLQFFIIIINTAFGAGMLSLHRSVADVAKEDMWLSVILGGVVFLFSFWAAAKVSQYFPQHSCIEYHRMLLGPVLGQVLNILLLLLLVLLTALSLRSFTTALRILLFELTPRQAPLAALLALAVYSAQYGLAPLLRLQQFLFLPNYILFLPLILLGLLAVDTKNYLPVLAEGFTPVLKGIVPSWFAYSGPELAAGFLYPFMTRQTCFFKWGAAGVIALACLYTLITVIVQGILGPQEVAHMLVPTLIAYRAVDIPDTFIERLDGYLMIVWVSLFFTSLINLLYFISFGTAQMLKLENSRPVLLLLAPVIFYMAAIPPNLQTVMALVNFYNAAAMVWGLGILPLLAGMAWLRAKRRRAC